MLRFPLRRLLSSFPPHEKIVFPSISADLLEGGIDLWRKKEGESIARGEVLVEITPTKNNTILNCECQSEAIFAKKLVSEKARCIAAGTVIAIVVSDPAHVAAFEKADFSDFNPEGTFQGVLATDDAAKYAARFDLDLKKIQGNGPHGLITLKNVKKFKTHGEFWEQKPYFQPKE